MAVNMSNRSLRPETIAAHALHATDASTGAVVPPLHMATTFARDENYVPLLKENYQRNGSPNLWQAEAALAALEKGPECLLFPSGMQAIATLFETIPAGAHVVALDTMYYGTRDWLRNLESRGRITLTLFNATDPTGLVNALRPGKTDLVWIETPLNPTRERFWLLTPRPLPQ
jgi:cystathionine gamma-synthase